MFKLLSVNQSEAELKLQLPEGLGGGDPKTLGTTFPMMQQTASFQMDPWLHLCPNKTQQLTGPFGYLHLFSTICEGTAAVTSVCKEGYFV